MSDPNLEEESLISQDDIDKLLDSSSIEEAEEKLETGDDDTPDLDELGELSQDDIDNLLTGNSLDTSTGESGDESSDDEMGELSQDDIDSLMGGNTDMETGNDQDMELISQGDIDQLMNSSAEDSAPGDSGDMDDEDDADDTDELISMDDVQDLMDEDEIIPQKVSSEGDTTNEASEPEPPSEVAVSDDYVIDEAEALDVSQCLITQETLDELIRNAPLPEDEPDPGMPDSDPEPEEPMADMDSEDFTPDPVVLDEDSEAEPISLEEQEPKGQGEDDLGLDASSDELEDMLNTDLDDTEFDMGSPDSDDVTQEDIDALLQESDEDEDEDLMDDEDDILISQDDIDTLLMSADQEDEDLLGDLMGDEMDASLDDDFDDEDILDGDGEEYAGHGGDQVVLEGGDDAGAEEGDSKSSGKSWKSLYKSKLVIATASAILVLGICVPSVYFLFFSQEKVQIPEKMPVPVVMEELGRDIEVASIDINASAVPDFKKSGNIILTNFVVLASDLSKDMAYVTADISIDYSDQRAYYEINDNLSFYRDLIYESIQKNLVWEKRNEVTEADLIWGIETTLKKVLPSDYIEKVSFKSFKAS